MGSYVGLDDSDLKLLVMGYIVNASSARRRGSDRVALDYVNCIMSARDNFALSIPGECEERDRFLADFRSWIEARCHVMAPYFWDAMLHGAFLREDEDQYQLLLALGDPE